MTSILARLAGKKVQFDLKTGLIYEGKLEKKEPTGLNKESSLSTWQSRWFRLYEDVFCWFKKETETQPAAMIPLFTVIYVAELKKEDARRFDIVLKGETETWTFPFRALSEEAADKWVEILKENVTKAQLLAKKDKSPLKFDLRGKFWKEVVHISITRERKKEEEERPVSPTKNTRKRHEPVRSGSLKKKAPLIGIWQSLRVDLFPDVLLYREPTRQNSSGAVALWNVVKVDLTAGNQFILEIKGAGSEHDRIVFLADTEDLAIDWVNDIRECHKEHGPETKEVKLGRLLLRGDEMMEEGDYDMAVDYYRQATELDSGNKEVQEKYLKARALYRKKFQESQIVEVKQLKMEGNDYFNHRDYVKAKECYDKAIELDPNNSLLYFNRAAACHFLLLPVAAEADSRKAVELDPESVDARTRLGLSLMKSKKYPEAKKVYEEALKLDPEDARAQKGLLGSISSIQKSTDSSSTTTSTTTMTSTTSSSTESEISPSMNVRRTLSYEDLGPPARSSESENTKFGSASSPRTSESDMDSVKISASTSESTASYATATPSSTYWTNLLPLSTGDPSTPTSSLSTPLSPGEPHSTSPHSQTSEATSTQSESLQTSSTSESQEASTDSQPSATIV